MAEPFSIAVAAIGVADIAIRGIRTVFGLVSSLYRASAELRYLRQRLVSLEQVLLGVYDLKLLHESYGYHESSEPGLNSLDYELGLCIEDLDELEKILVKPTTKSRSTFNRFGKAIKTVFAEDKIQKIAQRVEERKSAISVILHTIRCNTEFDIKRTLAEIRSRQSKIQGVVDRNGDILIKNGAVLRSIRDGTDIANRQLATFSGHIDARLAKLDKLGTIIKDLPIILSQQWSGDRSVIVSGSAEEAVSSLPFVLPFLASAFESMNRQSATPILTRDDMRWLGQEFRSLYFSIMKDAMREFDRHPGRESLRRRACQIKIQDHLRLKVETKSHQALRLKSTQSRVVVARRTKLDMAIFTGRIILSVSESALDNSFSGPGRVIESISLHFLPHTHLPIAGIVVSATYDWQGNFSVSPTLTTFGVIRAQESIWQMIEVGDLKGVQGVLSRRQIKPWDRDAESGNSLLAWAAWNHQIEICKVLIDQGADVLDCDTDGLSALSVFLQAIRHNYQPGRRIVDGSIMLIEACGSDLQESDRHITWDGSTTGTFSHGIVHRAILETFQGWMDDLSLQSCFEGLKILLDKGADPNERNGWGRTPLVTATFQVCLRMLPKVLTLMLKAKADPTVVDGDGEGILTRLFPTLSCCEISSLGSGWADDMIAVVVSFLKAGCDPSLNSDSGWTPSDNCLTPAAWFIWCESVTRAGCDMESILRREDENDGLHWSEKELTKKYEEALGGEIQPVSHWPGDRSQIMQMTCHLCGSSESCQPARKPFDLLGSYFKPGFNYHQSLHNHADGRLCKNYVVPDSCREEGHDEGLPLWPTTEDFSWRKHVAYRLWKNGKLGSSMIEARRWAVETS